MILQPHHEWQRVGIAFFPVRADPEQHYNELITHE
jgi:hypothetical protein